jgi:hypothetical protein
MRGRVAPRDPSRIILDSRPESLQTPDGACRIGSARLSSSGVDSNYRYKIDKKQKRRKSRVSFPMHGPFLASQTRADQAGARRARIRHTFLGADARFGRATLQRAALCARNSHLRYTIASAHYAPPLVRLRCDHRHTFISPIIVSNRHSVILATSPVVAGHMDSDHRRPMRRAR